MGATNWTDEQLQAIQSKGSNILVAAAAGSGKTAVLVERIIQKIINEKIDIDKLLVVTFTNAAASEMRERVLEAIYKKIEETPDNLHLQKQTILINKCNISTIHSFCLEVIKNNFYELDISHNFRIGDTTEIELMKQEVLEDLFEELYLSEDKNFLSLIDTYTSYRGDENLKELILKIYKYIQSYPFPKEELEKMVEKFNISSKLNEDFSKTVWGKILLNNVRETVEEDLKKLQSIMEMLKKEITLDIYIEIIQNDINLLENIYESVESWNKEYELFSNLKFETWKKEKKTNCITKDNAKKIRDEVKEDIKKIKDTIIVCDSYNANKDINEMYPILNNLKNVIIEFENRYAKKKKEKNIIDFNDIEHKALQLLLKKDENGNYIPSDVAKKYQNKFIEIAIDEYQDSNMVQEYILTSISKNNNIFMVGDVKQSIYKFRQAMPELFLGKYESYKLDKDRKEEDNLKIQLFKNFRSRKNILDITNTVFESIMSKNLGDIDYTEAEFLNLGADYPESEIKNTYNADIAELDMIDLMQEDDDKKYNEEDEENDKEESEEPIENTIVEAKFVANKIKELLNSNYYVYDKKKGYRKITYKDIVILLRSTKTTAPIYEKEISELNFPVFSDTSSEYLDTVEIQTIVSLLKLIDNPNNDIPLVTVLRSSIANFSDNDLIEMRLVDKNCSFYEVMKKALQSENVSDKTKKKIEGFFNNLELWRTKQEYVPLDELIWQIYEDTGYYNYVSLMPNGDLRAANLKMLFERAKEYENASFKGLFNFITYLDKLKTNNGDLSAAKLIGENDNVIRIMSIHKSKGLEFPVVFLCSTGKQFNMQDLNDNLLLHNKLGIGPEYINYERKIRYNTLAKKAIKLQMKKEIISEEMKVLYVALTRAKEKLIITGVNKNLSKQLKDKQEWVDIEKKAQDIKIPEVLIYKCKSYLDWLQLISIYNRERLKGILNVKEISVNDIMQKNNTKEEIKIVDIDDISNKKLDEKIMGQLNEKINWKYEYSKSTQIPSKTSVTKLKELSQENMKNTNFDFSNKPKENPIPEFIKPKTDLTSAQKGTIMHLCMQKINLRKEYTLEEISEFINKLVYDKIITEKEAETISKDQLIKFTKTDLAKRIRNSKEIYKEKPFYINISANEIYNEKIDENILVQGIIDLYFIDENNKLVLVDYKTDKIKQVDELIPKYKTQLELYKRALENALNRKVDEVYIYSIYHAEVCKI